MEIILSIDQSTSATKALLWDINGELLARSDAPHRQITDSRGWVEHDPEEIYRNTLESVRAVIKKADVDPGQIKVMGISNQRETAVCWNLKTGKPLYNAVVWQCNRAVDVAERVRNMGLQAAVREKTGLQLSPYFSAAKWGWMVKHSDEVRTAKQRGELFCGTIDSWLLHKLTGDFRTDYSNASRTQLFNLQRSAWDEELAEAFGINTNCLAEVCMSDSLFGYTNLEGILPANIPVHCMLGDSHAALFANQCRKKYSAKVTYGTGSSVMMNAGTSCPFPHPGLSASLAWGIEGQIEYVLEGNINDTGAVIKWLVEDIGLIPDAKSAGKIAGSVNDTGGVYLIPAFSGLSAPYYNDAARAAFLGMNRGTKRAHLVRAAEECIAYQIKDVVEIINLSCNKPMTVIRADGGPTRDAFLMQFQSDILDIPIEINATEELSGMGAAYCAAVGAGLTDSNSIFSGQRRKAVTPDMSPEQREALYTGWKNAVDIINKQTAGSQKGGS